MVDEKIYKLASGKEKILLARAQYKDKRYLLITEEENDDYDIAFEENGKLIIVNKENEDYENILKLLYKELEKEINNI